MQPVYLSSGETVGWLSDQVIFDWNGDCRAFVDDHILFSFEGQHLGYFAHNFFIDFHGHAVAFVDGAYGGPYLPVTAIPSTPPVFSAPLLVPLPPHAPLPPHLSGIWSPLTWDDYLAGS